MYWRDKYPSRTGVRTRAWKVKKPMGHYLITTKCRHTIVYVSVIYSIQLRQKLLRPGVDTQFLHILFSLLWCMLEIFHHKKSQKFLWHQRDKLRKEKTNGSEQYSLMSDYCRPHSSAQQTSSVPLCNLGKLVGGRRVFIFSVSYFSECPVFLLRWPTQKCYVFDFSNHMEVRK